MLKPEKMWFQCFKRYDKQDKVFRYFKVMENGTLIVTMGQGDAAGHYIITDYPIQNYYFDEPIAVSEFQSIFDYVQKKLYSKFELSR